MLLSFLMALMDYIKYGVEIVKLNGKTAVKISKDSDAFKNGLIILILAGIAQAVGSRNIFGIVINPIIMIIGAFIGTAIVQLFAILLGGKAKYMELFRSWSVANVLQFVAILGLIPFLGGLVIGLAGLWMIIVGILTVIFIAILTFSFHHYKKEEKDPFDYD